MWSPSWGIFASPVFFDRGRESVLSCAPPPSEPYVRFSRIRLSRRSLLSRRPACRLMGCRQGIQPLGGEKGLRPALMILSIKLYHLPPCTPVARAPRIRSVPTAGSTQPQGAGVSSAGLAGKARTRAEEPSGVWAFTSQPPCVPLLHGRYPASSLLRTL